MEGGNASAFDHGNANCHGAHSQRIGVASPAAAGKAICNEMQDRLAVVPHFATVMHNPGGVGPSRHVVEPAKQVQTGQHTP
jgi:hypothetical protein